MGEDRGALKVRRLESIRELQTVPEEAIKEDVRGPDETDLQRERAVKKHAKQEQCERQNKAVREVVQEGCSAKVATGVTQ